MKKGFTILELLLYVGILSVVIFSIAFFIQMMMSARLKSQTIAEVEQQGQQVMQKITQLIRNANAITVPSEGSSGSSLTLDTYDTGKNPTVIDVASNVLRIKEGTGAAISLTSSRVSVNGFSIQNLSRASTPGTVRIQFTLTHVNASQKNEFEYSKTFYASANIRK